MRRAGGGGNSPSAAEELDIEECLDIVDALREAVQQLGGSGHEEVDPLLLYTTEVLELAQSVPQLFSTSSSRGGAHGHPGQGILGRKHARLQRTLNNLEEGLEMEQDIRKLRRQLTSNRPRYLLDKASMEVYFAVRNLRRDLKKHAKQMGFHLPQGKRLTPLFIIPDDAGQLWWEHSFGEEVLMVKWTEFLERLAEVMQLSPLAENALLYVLDNNRVGIVTQFRFAEMLNSFGPFTEQNLEAIKHTIGAEWFEGYLSSKEAERLLFNREPGTFLARFCRGSCSHFGLSYVKQDPAGNATKVEHTVVRRLWADGMPLGFTFDASGQGDNFDTLGQLIEYYTETLVVPLNDPVNKSGLFYGDLTAKESQELLANKREGTFLFRMSSRAPNLAVSYCQDRQVKHGLVGITPAGHFYFEQAPSKEFPTIQQLAKSQPDVLRTPLVPNLSLCAIAAHLARGDDSNSFNGSNNSPSLSAGSGHSEEELEFSSSDDSSFSGSSSSEGSRRRRVQSHVISSKSSVAAAAARSSLAPGDPSFHAQAKKHQSVASPRRHGTAPPHPQPSASQGKISSTQYGKIPRGMLSGTRSATPPPAAIAPSSPHMASATSSYSAIPVARPKMAARTKSPRSANGGVASHYGSMPALFRTNSAKDININDNLNSQPAPSPLNRATSQYGSIPSVRKSTNSVATSSASSIPVATTAAQGRRRTMEPQRPKGGRHNRTASSSSSEEATSALPKTEASTARAHYGSMPALKLSRTSSPPPSTANDSGSDEDEEPRLLPRGLVPTTPATPRQIASLPTSAPREEDEEDESNYSRLPRFIPQQQQQSPQLEVVDSQESDYEEESNDDIQEADEEETNEEGGEDEEEYEEDSSSEEERLQPALSQVEYGVFPVRSTTINSNIMASDEEEEEEEEEEQEEPRLVPQRGTTPPSAPFYPSSGYSTVPGKLAPAATAGRRQPSSYQPRMPAGIYDEDEQEEEDEGRLIPQRQPALDTDLYCSLPKLQAQAAATAKPAAARRPSAPAQVEYTAFNKDMLRQASSPPHSPTDNNLYGSLGSLSKGANGGGGGAFEPDEQEEEDEGGYGHMPSSFSGSSSSPSLSSLAQQPAEFGFMPPTSSSASRRKTRRSTKTAAAKPKKSSRDSLERYGRWDELEEY